MIFSTNLKIRKNNPSSELTRRVEKYDNEVKVMSNLLKYARDELKGYL